MNFAAQEAADEMMVTSIPRWPTSAPDVYLNTRRLANKNGKTPTFTDEQMVIARSQLALTDRYCWCQYFDKFSELPPEIQVRVLSLTIC